MNGEFVCQIQICTHSFMMPWSQVTWFTAFLTDFLTPWQQSSTLPPKNYENKYEFDKRIINSPVTQCCKIKGGGERSVPQVPDTGTEQH